MGNEEVWSSSDGQVRVVSAGKIEVAKKRGYRFIDGYAVVREGRMQFPWMPKRDAIKAAKEQAAEKAAQKGDQ